MTQAQSNARPDKILILDDDARIRDLLRRYLAQEGFEVILAEDSKALNRIMLRDAVDLIVLDLMMPGEDGLSICRRLRAAGGRRFVQPCAAVGAQREREVAVAESKKSGVTHHGPQIPGIAWARWQPIRPRPLIFARLCHGDSDEPLNTKDPT